MALLDIVPTGNVAVALTPLAPQTNWQCVDEIPYNDAVDYVYGTSIVAYQQDTYSHGDGATGTINSLTVKYRAKCTRANDGASKARARSVLVSGGVTVYGAVNNLTLYFANYQDVYAVSPFTGLAWTSAEINALSFGISMVGGINLIPQATYPWCTQVYVQVDYSLATTSEPLMDGLVFVE